MSKKPFLWFAGLLVVILAVLFAGPLGPRQLFFNNDGPYGLMAGYDSVRWDYFWHGSWADLAWLGMPAISTMPGVTHGFYVLTGALSFAKFLVPLSLLIVGFGGWFFARSAGMRPAVAALVGIAAALNSNPVSYACWGLPPKAITQGLVLVALGLLLQNGPGWRGWAKTLLAGVTVGLAVMEGGDVGAIFSVYVAAFVAWQSCLGTGPLARQFGTGAGRLALVAVVAGLVATHALISLLNTQVIGVSGMQQTKESEAQRWAWATSFSFPKLETLRIVVPGLFGYRMDAPDGAAYWGSVGADGTPAGRFNGAGEYAGILVVLVAGFAVATSFRRDKSPFTPTERKWIWFWGAAAAVSLMLAWGQFGPLYRLVFHLPYFSTIRIPAKFLHMMHLALWILFAYGLEALARSHLTAEGARRMTLKERFTAWQGTAPAGERRWLFAMFGIFAVALVAAVIYASSAPALTTYLGKIQFSQSEPATAAFSIKETWLAMLCFAASLGVLGLMVVGWFGGARSKAAWWVLGGILVLDLLHADLPWVRHYDHVMRYQSNPVLDLLREKSWEQRVTSFLDPRRAGMLIPANEWIFLQKEWLEHHFQYYRIQSLDISQMPRTPELEQEFFEAFSLSPQGMQLAATVVAYAPHLAQLPADQQAQLRAMMPAAQKEAFLTRRLWELTNTRYLLGQRNGIEQLNELLDPAGRRFRVKMPFALGLKPGVPQPPANMPAEEIVQRFTAQPSESGPFAVIEFTGALPRTKLFNSFQVMTNDAATLALLRSPAFDPAQTVLLAETPANLVSSTDAAPGEAAITSYAPKHIVVKSKSAAAGVLLLNDRWHPDWKVTVDGQPAELLRANFIMRGVAVPAGEHMVEFRFQPPHGTLWVSLSALGGGLVLVGLLVLVPEKKAETKSASSRR